MSEIDEKIRACAKELEATMKEYAKTQICLATKGTKIWNTYMRPITMLLLAAAIGGHFVPDHSNSAEGQIKDAQLEVRVEQVEKAHKDIASDVRDVKKNVEEVERQMFIQTYILNEVAKEYNIEVPKSDGN